MEDLGFKQTKEEIQIAGFPDAVKVVQITGEKAKRLADLTLHRTDLKFAWIPRRDKSCCRGVRMATYRTLALCYRPLHEMLW